MTRCRSLSLSAFLAATLLASPAIAREPTFESDVRPLFKAYCFDCHGEGEKLRGGLDLRLRRLTAKGGDSGPDLLAGKPDRSLLYQRVKDGERPPGKKKLSAGEVEIIGRWIKAGAKAERPEPEAVAAGMVISAEDRSFWAFQPVRRPALPAVK